MDKRALILRWIEEQEALCAAAPLAPWKSGPFIEDEYEVGYPIMLAQGMGIALVKSPAGSSQRECDAEARDDIGTRNFVVASRSVLPLALAALRATVEGIRHEEVEDCWYTCPLALDNAGESLCCDEREVAAGRCTCGADARLDAIFCSLGLGGGA